jgi:hypothetical protein
VRRRILPIAAANELQCRWPANCSRAGDHAPLSLFDTSRADAILARFPGPVSLHIKRRRKLVSFALCLGLTVSFAWAVFVESKDSNGWIGLAIFMVFFGALTVRTAIIMLVPSIGGLTLEADSFSTKHFFHAPRISWRDVVGDFHKETISRSRGGLRVVAFEAAIASAWRGAPTKAKRMLHDNFELTLEELAWLMNEWRRRALTQPAGPRPSSTRRVSKFGRQPVNET